MIRSLTVGAPSWLSNLIEHCFIAVLLVCHMGRRIELNPTLYSKLQGIQCTVKTAAVDCCLFCDETYERIIWSDAPLLAPVGNNAGYHFISRFKTISWFVGGAWDIQTSYIQPLIRKLIISTVVQNLLGLAAKPNITLPTWTHSRHTF